jgi:hypothetical protein
MMQRPRVVVNFLTIILGSPYLTRQQIWNVLGEWRYKTALQKCVRFEIYFLK